MRLLLLSPEPTLQRRVQVLLDDDEGIVVAASSTADARRNLRTGRFDAALVDARQPRHASFAIELGGAPRDSSKPAVPVVALLDAATADGAAELLGAGVADVMQIAWLEPLLVKRLGPLIPGAQATEDPDGATASSQASLGSPPPPPL